MKQSRRCIWFWHVLAYVLAEVCWKVTLFCITLMLSSLSGGNHQVDRKKVRQTGKSNQLTGIRRLVVVLKCLSYIFFFGGFRYTYVSLKYFPDVFSIGLKPPVFDFPGVSSNKGKLHGLRRDPASSCAVWKPRKRWVQVIPLEVDINFRYNNLICILNCIVISKFSIHFYILYAHIICSIYKC